MWIVYDNRTKTSQVFDEYEVAKREYRKTSNKDVGIAEITGDEVYLAKVERYSHWQADPYTAEDDGSEEYYEQDFEYDAPLSDYYWTETEVQ